ncbi:collagen-binding protein [Bacteroidales bacterium]|nr:collagen-binding protein [Bacteroidales bacterium]
MLAQKNIEISGKIIDKSTEMPVEFASVRLLSEKDSALVTGEISNKDGMFTISKLAKGNYIIEILFLGYKPLKQSLILDGETKKVALNTLLLLSDDILLQEAVIIGKAAEIVVKNDTIEYNPDSYKTQENAVIEDLLKKLPGVEVDKDGKITVNGKEVKKFLVDGKEFFSDDPKVASKNLPVEMVAKLQVVDRKSDMARLTGFDDGEEETIINLTVKPGMKKGLIGNAIASYGHDVDEGDSRYEVSGMVNKMTDNDRYTLMINGNNTNNMGTSDMGGSRFGNMRGMRRGSGGINTSESIALNMNKEFTPKFTINGDLTYSSSDRTSSSKVNRETSINSEKSLIEKTHTNNQDISDNFGLNFRLEWKPDSSNTLIFRPNFSYNKSNSRQDQIFESYNGMSLDTLYNGRSESYNMGEGYNFGASLEYAYKFKKPGRVFSTTLSASFNDSYSQGQYDWNRRVFDQGIYSRDSLMDQRSENDNNSNNLRFNISHVEPLGKNNFLQLSYRIRQYDTESINSTYDMFRSGLAVDTAFLNSNQSRSSSRNSTEHRLSLNYKAVRTKYNYTIGLNIDPTKSTNKTFEPTAQTIYPLYPLASDNSRFPNIKGDSLLSQIDQDVINFSPIINFNYLFGQRTNLRIDYTGNTNQPSARQLQDFVDVSDPMNSVKGNPNLKPSYSNDLSARFSKFVPQSQMFYNLDFRGRMSFNDIASTSIIDPSTGARASSYENVDRNWNAQIRAMFNTPLRNKKFTVGNFFSYSLNNQKGFSNGDLNTMKTYQLRDGARANYRSDIFDLGVTANFAYANSVNQLQPDRNQQTYDWGMGFNTAWYLPNNFTIESDIAWSDKSGYSDGFNIAETIWNASILKQVFNKRVGTGSLRLKIYDILQNRNSISRSTGSNYIEDRESTVLSSFFTLSFIYKFSIFPGGKNNFNENEMRGSEGRGRRL